MVSLLKWNPYQLLMDWLKVHIHIGFETLKVKCIIYGICSQVTFKHAKTMFFSKLGRTDNNFRSYSEISPEGYPNSDLTSPKVRVSIQGPGELPNKSYRHMLHIPVHHHVGIKAPLLFKACHCWGPKESWSGMHGADTREWAALSSHVNVLHQIKQLQLHDCFNSILRTSLNIL